MPQFHHRILVLGSICAVGIGLTALQSSSAQVGPAVTAGKDRIQILEAKLEILEKRLTALEAERDQATRQASAQIEATPLLPVPKPTEAARPQAKFFLLKQSQNDK